MVPNIVNFFSYTCLNISNSFLSSNEIYLIDINYDFITIIEYEYS